VTEICPKESEITLKKFLFFSPNSVEEAIKLLNQEGAIPIAGGTDLIVLMQENRVNLKALIDLSSLDLGYIRKNENYIHIGALTTFAAILENDLVRRTIPVLAQAASQIGSVQTRNMATLGGNLCSAVPSADSAPVLLVLDASVCLIDKNGVRFLPLQHFFVGPRKTLLNPGELLVEVIIPLPAINSGTYFAKLGRRKSLSLAVVNAASMLRINREYYIEDARIALGAVAPVPVRAKNAENLLRGKILDESLLEEAVNLVDKDISPIDDFRASAAYRSRVSRVLARRTLQEAWKQAKQALMSEVNEQINSQF
jgi:probable selenate reductase FAD-binding subunit